MSFNIVKHTKNGHSAENQINRNLKIILIVSLVLSPSYSRTNKIMPVRTLVHCTSK